jgi:hypothetical protein
MTKYLAELYLPRSGSDGLHDAARRARTAAKELTAEGTAVRYLRSIFVPQDETYFLLYEAESADAVAEASARAGIAVERIVDAVLPT